VTSRFLSHTSRVVRLWFVCSSYCKEGYQQSTGTVSCEPCPSGGASWLTFSVAAILIILAIWFQFWIILYQARKLFKLKDVARHDREDSELALDDAEVIDKVQAMAYDGANDLQQSMSSDRNDDEASGQRKNKRARGGKHKAAADDEPEPEPEDEPDSKSQPSQPDSKADVPGSPDAQGAGTPSKSGSRTPSQSQGGAAADAAGPPGPKPDGSAPAVGPHKSDSEGEGSASGSKSRSASRSQSASHSQSQSKSASRSGSRSGSEASQSASESNSRRELASSM
jgi:hypothetical protein